MEEERQVEANVSAATQHADDTRGDGDAIAGPSSQHDSAGSQKKKKPWREGYVIKRKQKPTEDTSEDVSDTVCQKVSGNDKNNDARASSSSSSSSESEAGEGSSGSSNSSESEEEEDCAPPPVKKPRVEVDTYSRFDPGVGDQFDFVLPTADMVEYVTKMFTNYLPDKKIRETITEDYPVPKGVPGLVVPKIDPYIPEIFLAKKMDYGKNVDDQWAKVQHRTLDVMGPLSKLWTLLEAARLGEDSEDYAELDLFECLDLVEKTLTLLGQANVSFNHFRRQNFLFRLTKDGKKTKSLLKDHEETLVKSYELLFGKSFYKKLSKSAKIRKESREISAQLGDNKPKGKPNYDSRQSSSRGRGGGQSQPFRNGPSSNRGGGRKVQFSKRGKQNGNRGKFFVSFRIRNGNYKRSSSKYRDSVCRPKRGKPTRLIRVKRNCPYSKRLDGVRGFTPGNQGPPIQGGTTVHSNRGAAIGVCQQLGNTNPGPTHPTDGQGSEDTLSQPSGSAPGTVSVSPVRQGVSPGLRGSDQYVGERSHYHGFSKSGPVCESPLSRPEERRVTKTCDQLEKVEFLRDLCSLQNGGVTPPERTNSAKRLLDQSRLEGRLFQRASGCKPSTVSTVQMGEQVISVPLHALRAGACSTSVHQNSEASNWSSTSSGSTDNSLPGRHDSDESKQRRSDEGSQLSNILANAIRVCDQLEEVTSSSDPDLRFLGVYDRYHQDDAFFTPRQDCQNYRQMSGYDYRQNCQSQDIGGVGGVIDLVSEGNSPSTFILPSNADGTDQGLVSRSVLRDKTHSNPGGYQRTPVVDSQCEGVEWQGHNDPLPRPNNRDRRFFERLGSGVERTPDWGCLESGGKGAPHQCVGAERCSICNKILCSRAQTSTCPSQDGQYLRSSLHSEDGGGTRSTPLLKVAQELWGFCLERDILLSAEYLPGRLNVQADWESRHLSDTSDWRLKPTVFQQIQTIWGPFQIDLFASRHNAQLERYVSWKQDPYALAVDAFLLEWRNQNAYLFPPFAMIPRCLAKVYKDQATVVIITPTWQSQAWYPSLLEMSIDLPILLPQMRDMLVSPRGEPHPLSVTNNLMLAAWKVSGDRHLQEGFRQKLPLCWQSTPGGRAPLAFTKAPGDSGVAGASKGRLIHFTPLWRV